MVGRRFLMFSPDSERNIARLAKCAAKRIGHSSLLEFSEVRSELHKGSRVRFEAAYYKLVERFKLRGTDVASVLGVTRSTLCNYLLPTWTKPLADEARILEAYILALETREAV
jgi:hypothetical protein